MTKTAAMSGELCDEMSGAMPALITGAMPGATPIVSRGDSWTAELLVLASVVFATVGQLSLKLGVGHSAGLLTWAPGSLHRPFTVGVLLGLMLYGLGSVLWVLAVGMKPISYLYPLASASYVLVALGGWLVLGETQHAIRWVGVAVMICGILLLTSEKDRRQT